MSGRTREKVKWGERRRTDSGNLALRVRSPDAAETLRDVVTDDTGDSLALGGCSTNGTAMEKEVRTASTKKQETRTHCSPSP